MTSSTIALPTNDGACPAYLAMPERANGAAVVVLQEIFGVNANIRAIADDHAAHGYLAIAPDLFWRQRPGVDLDPSDPASRDTAMTLMQDLDQSLAVADAETAARYVRARAGGKVGAVGYCLGGKLAYFLAMTGAIEAAVSYYGTGIHAALDRADAVACPLLLHVAQEDNLCPPEAQAALRERFEPMGDRVTIEEYAGVGHAFARRGAPTCDTACADRADAETAAFFARHLGAGA